MRIERTCSPKKIIIENNEDQEFILDVLNFAFKQLQNRWIGLGKEDLVSRRILDLEKSIRL